MIEKQHTKIFTFELPFLHPSAGTASSTTLFPQPFVRPPYLFFRTRISQQPHIPSRQDALDRVHDSGRQQRIITQWRFPALPLRSPGRQRQHSRRPRPPGQPRKQRRPDEHGRQGPRGPDNPDDGTRKDSRRPSPDKVKDSRLLPSRHCYPDRQRMSNALPPPLPLIRPRSFLECVHPYLNQTANRASPPPF